MRMKVNLESLEVRDAREPLDLHIRPADCKDGKKSPTTCAAAKAACRVPGVLEAHVYRARTMLLIQRGGKRFWEKYMTPQSLRAEIISFDRGAHFEPGTYTLNPPPPSAQAGYYKKSRPGRHDLAKSRRATPHVVRGIRPHAPHAW